MTDLLLKQDLPDATAINDAKSFIAQIEQALGEKQWQELNPDIKNRFTNRSSSRSLRYIGVVKRVYCSITGKLIARLLKPLELLPDRCARDVAFDFLIQRNKNGLLKQRRYYLEDTVPFTFRSVFSSQPIIHEEFKAGLGMKLKLSVKNGNLIFRDDDYFWRFKNWRIPIPAWLSIGRFELVHRNIDRERFAVSIRIAHPLLGVLFYQHGEFQKF